MQPQKHHRELEGWNGGGEFSPYGLPPQLHTSTRMLLLLYLGGCKPWPWSWQQLRRPERRLCFLSAHHSSFEQSTTTSNFQEQFSNSGERKLTQKKNISKSCLWSNLLRFVLLIENSINIQKKIRTAVVRFFYCTYNMHLSTHTQSLHGHINKQLCKAFYRFKDLHDLNTSNI